MALGLACALTACRRGTGALEPSVPPPPRLTVEQVAQLVPSNVKDREGWAQDILAALEAEEIAPSPPAVCSVVAVIEQESGFKEDPAVPGLANLVRARLEAHADKLGALGTRRPSTSG
jgi:hypothetical protein